MAPLPCFGLLRIARTNAIENQSWCVMTGNTFWHDFLGAQGARFAAGEVTSFGNPLAELRHATTGAAVTDLTHLGLIEVRGADAAAFLQGQLSCDVHAVDATHANLGAFCSPKGRVLASFVLFKRAAAYYLLLRHAIADSVVRRLRLYVLRAKVEISDRSEEWVRIGLMGAGTGAHLAEIMGAVVPISDYAVSGTPDTTVLRLPLGRILVVAPPERSASVWQGVAGRAEAVTPQAWRLGDIRAGLPLIHPSTSDLWVPQMINLHWQAGVSFTKGCYPGQEIVARLHYLGKLKRRMFRAHVDAEPPAPGTALHCVPAEGQDMGLVVDAAPRPDGGAELLAVVPVAAVGAGEVHITNASGAQLRFLELPYPTPDAAATETGN